MPERKRATSLSPHDFLLLDQWGRDLDEAFRSSMLTSPYLVGSVLDGGAYRDVDVRMLTSDPWVLTHDLRLRTLNMCVSMWGRQVTGLPVDFQFQPEAEFHRYDGHQRNALGINPRIRAQEVREALGYIEAGDDPGPSENYVDSMVVDDEPAAARSTEEDDRG